MYRNIYILTKIKLLLGKKQVAHMNTKQKNVNIWIWIQNGKILKAISNVNEGTVKIYDEEDRLVLKRTGLNKIQVKQIENNIIKYGAKKLDKHAEPYRFL